VFHEIKVGRLVAHMTAITLFELYRGARLSPEPERRVEEVKSLRWYIGILPFDEAVAEVASEVCVLLEKRGEPIDIRDLFIGASAKAVGMPLTTRNVAHFERIPGLRVLTPKELLEG